MEIPFEPVLFGIRLNIHLILEYLAFFTAFRYYMLLRRKKGDRIEDKNRLSIILGATLGALIGSRVAGFLENPAISISFHTLFLLLNTKSIMGGLFGGLLGVELAKKLIHEKKSSGDLFTFPIILGILIGRIGCFLNGINEFTYGDETSFFTGMNLGDGIKRHPLALYEIVFLIFLFYVLKKINIYVRNHHGLLFQLFMIAYFGFRFFIEFLKPNVFFFLGLSSIQWLCIVCWIYYFPTIRKIFQYANKKIYLLRLYH